MSILEGLLPLIEGERKGGKEGWREGGEKSLYCARELLPATIEFYWSTGLIDAFTWDEFFALPVIVERQGW